MIWVKRIDQSTWWNLRYFLQNRVIEKDLFLEYKDFEIFCRENKAWGISQIIVFRPNNGSFYSANSFMKKKQCKGTKEFSMYTIYFQKIFSCMLDITKNSYEGKWFNSEYRHVSPMRENKFFGFLLRDFLLHVRYTRISIAREWNNSMVPPANIDMKANSIAGGY